MGAAADVRTVLDLVASRPPRLTATTRLVCIDGPAGSGKSTLAAQVMAAAGPTTQVIHLDLLLDGWHGLDGVVATLVDDVLVPLSDGRRATYRRYDWHAGRFAERVEVPSCDLLVVEGVGAGSRGTAPYRSVSVWLEAPEDVRRRRALARDGETFAPHWDAWAAQEGRLFATEAPKSTADLVLTTVR